MDKIEEIQKKIIAAPERTDVKTCLQESSFSARRGDTLLSIKFLVLAIYGVMKIRDLTKPERNTFNDNIGKVLGSMDLMPLVKEATYGKKSLIDTFEEEGLKKLFSRLQTISKDIKKLEKKALQINALEKKEEIRKNFEAISKELEKGNVAAAKNKADRILKNNPKKRSRYLEKIIAIFEEKEVIKGWWHYFQKRYDPKKCTLEEARDCAAKIAKMRSLDDKENEKAWYRNNLDYRLRVWELTPKDDQAEIESVIEACYNLAICVYYYRDKINGKMPKAFGQALIGEGLKLAPDSSHLKKMGKTFGVTV